MSQRSNLVSPDNRLMVGADGAVYALPGTKLGALRTPGNPGLAPTVPPADDSGEGSGCYAYAPAALLTDDSGVGSGCYAYAPAALLTDDSGVGSGCYAYAPAALLTDDSGSGSGCYAY
jgi:hypothetical protein